MLKSFYEYTGFFGSLILSLLVFLFFIFWIGGIAGITLPVDGGKAKYNKWQVLAAIFIPIYPVFWFISDIITQHRFMKKN